jgi:hypothetical protein
VLPGRLGLAVFPIWSRRNVAPTPDLGIATRAAVFGVEALATAAGRGTGRGTILAMARGGISLDNAVMCAEETLTLYLESFDELGKSIPEERGLKQPTSPGDSEDSYHGLWSRDFGERSWMRRGPPWPTRK